jgi:hypothetical protein
VSGRRTNGDAIKQGDRQPLLQHEDAIRIIENRRAQMPICALLFTIQGKLRKQPKS